MPRQIAEVSMDFSCPPEKVWRMLTHSGGYALWYREIKGFSERTELAPGARIQFAGDVTTSVVTAYEPERRLVFAAGTATEEFLIAPRPDGSSVTLRASGSAADAAALRRTLERLRSALASPPGSVQPARSAARRFTRRSAMDIISNMIQGYRNPIDKNGGVVRNTEELSSVVDLSEGDVVISPRAAIVALCCMLVLFVTLNFTFRFERSEVVPSSGLSIMENADVNKAVASTLYIGQSKNSLERTLNCVGSRLSSTDYYYCSTEFTADGRRAVEVYISYDAYARARRIFFIDNNQEEADLGLFSLENERNLTSMMAPLSVEEEMGIPLTAFCLDKSGVNRVYFGRYDGGADGYDAYATAQLVVTLQSERREVDTRYYPLADRHNPLQVTALDRRLKTQYTNIDLYLADYYAYARMFLLSGHTPADVALILGAEAELQEDARGGTAYIYSAAHPDIEEKEPRYVYEVTFNEQEQAVSVRYTNRYLQQREDTLGTAEELALADGMTLYEVYAATGVLPAYAECDSQTLWLCYGARLTDYINEQLNYSVLVTLDRGDDAVTDASFHKKR